MQCTHTVHSKPWLLSVLLPQLDPPALMQALVKLHDWPAGTLPNRVYFSEEALWLSAPLRHANLS